MNSYNENLNSVVLTSLQNQSLAEKSIYSKLNATMFKLYYAEGATISAGEKLEAAKVDMGIKEAVKNTTVNNTNMSNNLLASATQANRYYKQSINNMAVCAANVQVASNAIVKLASDIGSIFSIVQAADRDSDVYKNTEIVRSYIDNTAHAAEEASKLAMDASMYTSEVSVPTVLDKANSTNVAINNLLTINSKAFDDASKVVNNYNATLATVSAKEKLAEGAMEDIAIDYKATKQAYNSTNRELNLNLWVTRESDAIYKFTFDQINNPFHEEDVVEDYHLIFVKDSKKATFTISNAELIRLDYLSTAPETVSKQFIDVVIPKNGPIEKTLDVFNYPFVLGDKQNPVVDSDGDNIKLGVDYVVFVMAVFKDKYKREINNFNDFLSAPSQVFTLTNTLNRIKSNSIHVEQLSEKKSDEELKMELDFKISQNVEVKLDFEFQEENGSDFTHKVTFTTLGTEPFNPIYRCIFLPATSDLNDYLLTTSSLQQLIEKSLDIVHDAEGSADSVEVLVKKYQKEIADIDEGEKESKKDIARLTKLLAGEPSSKDAKKWQEELEKRKTELTDLQAKKQIAEKLLNEAKEREKEDKVSQEEEQQAQLPFLFNLTIAEQVSASNYTQMKTKDKIPHPIPGHPDHKKESDAINWYAFFGPETTDNFGNFLIDGQPYFPVILTVSKDGVDNPNNYTNALSHISVHSKFNFHSKKPSIN